MLKCVKGFDRIKERDCAIAYVRTIYDHSDWFIDDTGKLRQNNNLQEQVFFILLLIWSKRDRHSEQSLSKDGIESLFVRLTHNAIDRTKVSLVLDHGRRYVLVKVAARLILDRVAVRVLQPQSQVGRIH